MTDRVPPEEADLPSDITIGEAVTRVWKEDDWWMGSDGNGEFRLRTGSPTPNEASELGYDPCNCVVSRSIERYGEKRYCKGMSGTNFAQDYETCKAHKSRSTDEWKQARADRFKTGARARSHATIFQYLEPHERIIANDIYSDLVGQSKYDFSERTVAIEVDVSDTSFGADNDVLIMSHPFPTENQARCKALWHAALDFVTMESIREEQFREAFEEDAVNAVGSEWTVVASGEGGPVYDTDEHHLNLPLSRMQKDYERHLKFGGVEYEEESTVSDAEAREYVVEFWPEDEGVEPEAQRQQPSPLTQIDKPGGDD